MEEEIKQLRKEIEQMIFQIDILKKQLRNIEKLFFHFHEVEMINFIAEKTKNIIKERKQIEAGEINIDNIT